MRHQNPHLVKRSFYITKDIDRQITKQAQKLGVTKSLYLRMFLSDQMGLTDKYLNKN